MDTISLKVGESLPVLWAKGPCVAESADDAIFVVKQGDFAANNFEIVGRTVGAANLTMHGVDGVTTDIYSVQVVAAPDEGTDGEA